MPGAFRSHSSALAPVMDSRGSICTNVPARPWANACIRREARRVGHWLQPRLEEVRAEREQIARLADGVVRDAVLPEGDAIGGAQRLVAQRLVGDARSCAERARPLVHEAREVPDLEAGHQRDLGALASLRERAQLLGELLLRFVPAHRLAAGERAAEAIRMVEALQPGLSANAERAPLSG